MENVKKKYEQNVVVFYLSFSYSFGNIFCPRSLDPFYIARYYINWLRLLGHTLLFCFQGRSEWTTGTLQPYEKGVSKNNKPKKTTTM